MTLALAVSGCSTAIFARKGASKVQEGMDWDACMADMKNGGMKSQNGAAYTGGTAAGAVGAGIASGWIEGGRQADYLEACMNAKGYKRIVVSREEFDHVRSLDHATDAPYRDELLAKYGGGAPVSPAAR